MVVMGGMGVRGGVARLNFAKLYTESCGGRVLNVASVIAQF